MCSCTTKETVALSFKITINLLKTLQDQRVSASINLIKPAGFFVFFLHFSFLFFFLKK